MYNNKSFCQEISIGRNRPELAAYNIQYSVNIIKYLNIVRSKALISMQINPATIGVFNFSYKSNAPDH
jgi:hypothetical protein